MTAAIEKVWAHIDENKDIVVELTRELVQIPSVNPKFHVDEKLNRESDTQNLVQSTLEVAGFDTDRANGAINRRHLVR